MRKLKKLVGFVLALAMVLGLTVTSFADEPTTYTITINNSTDGYTYTAYQIFKGDLSGSTLSNIEWGDDVDVSDATSLYSALAAIADTTDSTNTKYPFKDADENALATAADVADALADYADKSAVAEAFAQTISSYITDSGTESTKSGNAYIINGLEAGYYLVKNTSVPSDGAYTEYILRVVKDVEVDPKSDVPSVDKAVSDLDANIGDTVTYYLAATLPDNYADYDTYKLVFNDTMSAGLTYSGTSLKVLVFDSLADYEGYLAYQGAEGATASAETATGTVVKSDGYTSSSDSTASSDAEYVGGTDITINITDTNALVDGDDNSITVTKDSIIVVEFQATLNENAVIGGNGNPNEVYLAYSNNPNSGGDNDTGKTPEDKVVTWTFELDVTKVDGKDDTKTLADAEFVLYRLNSESNKEYVQLDDNKKVTGWTTTEASATTLKSDASGNFKVIGLDVGTYYLEETVAPTGYNKLSSDIELVINATYNQETGSEITDDYLTLTTLTATADKKDLTTDTDTGVIGSTVANNSGSSLPSTGGIGTTIFYVIGGVLVAGAAVLLITRRRMRSV